MNENKPLVSIKCTVYNHEPYLRQCLDGFVMQKTNFSFEAIVHDDASTDGSAAIIREYAEKYPDIIKPIYETENQYSKKDGSLTRIMNEAVHPDAKYFASCEGDDYWTDPLKLQKQFDFLESHNDYVMCVHNVDMYLQKSDEYIRNIGEVKPNTSFGFSFDLKYYCSGKKWVTRTLTNFYRRSAVANLDVTKYECYKDRTFYFLLLKQGKGMYFNDVMAVYRVHSGGVCSGNTFSKNFLGNVKGDCSIYDNQHSKDAMSLLKHNLIQNFYYLVINRDFETLKKVVARISLLDTKRPYIYMFISILNIPIYFIFAIIKKIFK